MRIAIQAADLDHPRIDGTRVYISSLLKRFGKLSPGDDFYIYHRRDFNAELAPPDFENYHEKKVGFPWRWTQTRFAWELWRDRPYALWMPMHNIPYLKRKSLETTVTIHDLAFKYFPDHFPRQDLRRLDALADMAIGRADKLIAVSQATKNDILKFYPQIKENKIRVIHHGFDSALFQKEISEKESDSIVKKYKLKAKSYMLYVGALQPRKNLDRLVEAFEIVKKTEAEMKLVLVGEKAWLWEGLMKKIGKSPFRNDIVLTGKVPFFDLPALYRGASVFVFPSLYEGFGIPVLEAMASGVPVVASDNSSIPEVAGDGAFLVNPLKPEAIAEAVGRIVSDEKLRSDLVRRGSENVESFSWEKCAKETLEIIQK